MSECTTEERPRIAVLLANELCDVANALRELRAVSRRLHAQDSLSPDDEDTLERHWKRVARTAYIALEHLVDLDEPLMLTMDTGMIYQAPAVPTLSLRHLGPG